jgi:molybdopterin/thiamine biosynthesis adenylyltransferase
MEDRPYNLKLFYKEAAQKAAIFLREEYKAVLHAEDLPDSPLVCNVVLDLEGKSIELIVQFPESFPDTFPVIALSEKSFNEICPIPHLDWNRHLCTFDKNETFPNAELPVEVVRRTIERAREILENGLNKQNTLDFIEEFAAYWEHDTEGTYYSIIEPTDEPKIICLCKTSIAGCNKVIFADVNILGDRWLKNLYGEDLEIKHINSLYLPLKDIGHPPFPRTNKELYLCIKQQNPDRIGTLNDYLKNMSSPSFIIFSLKLGDQYFLGAWAHSGLNQIMNGFRPGKAPTSLMMLIKAPNVEIKRFGIERVDRSRILNRGGNSSTLPLDGKKISVIGCGSIGSNLAEKLVKLGCNDLFLVDNDKLEYGNIARHFCGAEYVDLMKTKALAKKLIRHYPNLIITTYEKNILDLLYSNQNFLNAFDINIICIGSIGIELRLNKLLKETIITKPLLFIWVEPYLAAGHAVYIQPGKSGCLNCLFLLKEDNLIFRESVLKNPEKYTKREAGCQTSFIPYGAIEIDAYLVSLSRFLIKIAKGLDDNTIFSWVGNMETFRRFNFPIESKWIGVMGYTVYESKIQQKYYCEDCLK